MKPLTPGVRWCPVPGTDQTFFFELLATEGGVAVVHVHDGTMICAEMCRPCNCVTGVRSGRRQLDVRILAGRNDDSPVELKCTKGGKARVLNVWTSTKSPHRVAARFEPGGARVDGVKLPFPTMHAYEDYRFEALGATWTSEDGRQPLVYSLGGGAHVIHSRRAVFVYT
jgi:hypothetical protein